MSITKIAILAMSARKKFIAAHAASDLLAIELRKAGLPEAGAVMDHVMLNDEGAPLAEAIAHDKKARKPEGASSGEG